ncbi:hypothetical protein N8654_03915 [Synechococcus sp. AH-601-B19]|nr:hypothetical protein [Synechococcus sp. AH-601-B19]
MTPTIFVSVNNPIALTDYGRYHYLLLKFLSFSECRLIVDSNCLLASIEYNELRYGSYIRTDTDLNKCLSFKPPNVVEYDYVLSDDPDHYSNKTVIYLIYGFMCMNKFSISSRDIQMPQPMHPVHYYCKDLSRLLDSHRHYACLDKRPIVIAFNGNKSSVYSNSFRYDELYISPRFDVVSQFDTYYSNLGSQNMYANEYFSTPSKVPQKDLFSYIAKSKYFFCPPGYKNPLCHNLAEALHAGSVPVLAYSKLLAPPLDHLENCLSYDGLDLFSALDVAFADNFSAYSAMKNNALEYYMNTMMPHSFFKNLMSLLSSAPAELNMYMPFFEAAN